MIGSEGESKEDLALSPADLLKKSQLLYALAQSVDEQKSSVDSRVGALEKIVSEAKTFVDRAPKTLECLQMLQDYAHQRTVGVYEQLLTAIVTEVLPGPRQIKLTLKTERGMSALHLTSIKNLKSTKSESILSGSGGSLVNVLSTGLRLIALARSDRAPFIMLDEADCWLKPSRVGQFASIIGQVANELGIQVLMISHHEPVYFDQSASIVRLVKKTDSLDAQRLSSPPIKQVDISKAEGPSNNTKKSIAMLRLINFMSHTDTRIPLSAFTCITGENDIGKSAIAAALRSVFYAESEDEFVQHEKADATIEVHFTDQSYVKFIHQVKKSPKRIWEYFMPGLEKPVLTSSSKGVVPEWLDEVFSVKKFDDLDVQLLNQKTPVFLLAESPSKRAQILSIGRDSDYLQSMSIIHKQKVADHNKLISSSEAEHAKLTYLTLQEFWVEDVKKVASDLLDGVQKVIQEQEFSKIWIDKFNRLQQLKLVSEISLPNETEILPHSAIKNTANISAQLKKFRVIQKIGALALKSELSVGVNIKKTIELSNTLLRLRMLDRLSHIKVPTEEVGVMEIKIVLSSTVQKISMLRKYKKLSSIQLPSKEVSQMSPPVSVQTGEALRIRWLTNELKALKANRGLEVCRRQEEILLQRQEKLSQVKTACPVCKQVVSFEKLLIPVGEHRHE